MRLGVTRTKIRVLWKRADRVTARGGGRATGTQANCCKSEGGRLKLEREQGNGPIVSGPVYVSLHFAMYRLITIFMMSLLTWRAAEAQSTNEIVRLRVTVLDVTPLPGFSGSLTPTGDVDPHFALTLRIDSCVPVVTNLTAGAVVTFAVHSPALFLRGSAEKGTTHEMTMPRKKAMNLDPEHSTKQTNHAPSGLTRTIANLRGEVFNLS